MAIDKAIDSVKLESDLSSIADAIREKGGTSDELAFPAGFVSAIGAISAGGGGAKIATGTFILDEEADSVEITHGLGEVPYIAMYFLESHLDSIRDVTVTSETTAFAYSINGTHSSVQYNTGSKITSSLSLGTMATKSFKIDHKNSKAGNGACVICNANENTAILYPLSNTSVKFAAGNRYRWIMIAESAK